MSVGIVTASLLAAIAADLRADARLSLGLTSRLGQLPTGTVNENGEVGGSELSVDGELTPALELLVRNRRTRLALQYTPRFLVRFLDGEPLTADGVPFEDGGRPVLQLQVLTAVFNHRLAERWAWNSTFGGQIGEQDFAAFLAGAGNVAAPNSGPIPPNGGAGSVVTESGNIFIRTLSTTHSLTGPFVGRDDLRFTVSANISSPEDSTGMVSEGAEDDPLCFGEGAGGGGGQALGLLAATCNLGFDIATVSNLTARDQLEIRAGYAALDFDPGPFLHSVFGDVTWARRLTRTTLLTVRAGGVVAFDTDPLEGVDTVQPLPRLLVSGRWNLIRERLFLLEFDLTVGADGFMEPTVQRFLLQAQATTGLSATIRQDLQLIARASAFTLGPELDCPPRQAADMSPLTGCGELPMGATEVQDLSSIGLEFSGNYRVNANLNIVMGARYGRRAPHITRLDAPADPTLGNQEDVSGEIGLVLTWGTQRAPGIRGAGAAGGGGAGGGGGGAPADPGGGAGGAPTNDAGANGGAGGAGAGAAGTDAAGGGGG